MCSILKSAFESVMIVWSSAKNAVVHIYVNKSESGLPCLTPLLIATIMHRVNVGLYRVVYRQVWPGLGLGGC